MDADYKPPMMRFDDIMKEQNLALSMSDEDLSIIGKNALDGHTHDLASREAWEEKMAAASKVAMQVAEQKSFPWPGSSNVRFPLITMACLQFASRSYPQLVNQPDLVRCRIPEGLILTADQYKEARAQAARIGNHMSHQLLDQEGGWEEQFDRLLMILPLVGCAFREIQFDTYDESNKTDLVLPNDLIVNYWTKDLNTAERVGRRYFLSKNEIESRVRSKFFREYEVQPQPIDQSTDPLDAVRDDQQGLHDMAPELALVELIQQHCWIDLDGDGYAEPYIVTFERLTSRVRRIVKRFSQEGVKREGRQIARIIPDKYFVKYTFMPSPDGGFYEMGLGILLGDLNETISTLLNQLIDAGTMSNTGGGFVARGIKLRGGAYTFRPNEWKQVDAVGGTLKDSIVPLPVREPSGTLMQLLSLLIEYGERIVGVTDVMTGVSPGQNTPAETSRNTIAQGLKIYSGIVKRVYRSLTAEFRMLFVLNAKFYKRKPIDFVLEGDYQQASQDMVGPGADPQLVSDELRLQQCTAVLEVARTTPPGVFNMREVLLRFLKAYKVTDIESVLPDPAGPNALPMLPNPKVEQARIEVEADIHKAQLAFKAKLAAISAKAPEVAAKVAKLQAEAQKALADAAATGMNADMGKMKLILDQYDKAYSESVELTRGLIGEEQQSEQQERHNQDGVGGVAGSPGNAAPAAGHAGGGAGGSGPVA